jgi:D-alanine-D-alanine ligase-like ATP-grasp enzyme
MRSPGREAADAAAFAAKLGYPVFCKPNLGSRGTFAEIVTDEAALTDYVRRVAVEFESFLVEPVMRGNEHRVLVQDGRPVFVSTKSAPVLVGDGRSTLRQLLDAMNAELAREGVSATPAAVLGDGARVLAAGERFTMPGRRNLSAAGAAEHVSTDVPAPLAKLACEAVAAIELRLGAVDLFDVSGDLVVIEVNGNPGLKTLELAGRMDLIRGIWTSMLNACLDS